MRKICIALVAIVFSLNLLAKENSKSANEKVKKREFNFQLYKGEVDTLVPASFLTGTPKLYPGSVGYITGTNDYGDLAKAQQFVVDNDEFAIIGLITWIGVNNIQMGDVSFKIWDFDTIPGAELAIKTVSFNEVIGGDSSNQDFLYTVYFEKPVIMNHDFVVGAEWGPDINDGFGIISTTMGDANEADLIWEKWKDGHWDKMMEEWQGFDVDMGFFPIVQRMYTDVGILEAKAPVNETGCSLTNSEDVIVVFENLGNEVIDSLIIAYAINGGEQIAEAVKNINLNPGDSFEYQFNQQADLAMGGEHEIEFQVFSDNDINSSNDIYLHRVVNNDAIITINLTTDDLPEETSWKLTDLDGMVIAENDILKAETTTSINICVASVNCYMWTIYDTYGDGLAGLWKSGTFTVLLNDEVIATCLSGGNFGSEFSIAIGECAANDIALSQLKNYDPVKVGNSVDLKGTVINMGLNTLNSFDISYNISDGEEVATFSESNLSLEFGDSYEFTHDVPMFFDQSGVYEVNVSVNNPNGASDNESNNTLSSSIIVYDESVERTVLLEEFSTEQCPNCPIVGNYLSNIDHNDDQVVMIVHHTGFYIDQFSIYESDEMLVFYNNNGYLFAPAAMTDRHYNGLNNDDVSGIEPGPVFSPASPYGQNRINSRKEKPAFVSVNIDATYDADQNKLTATVSGKFFIDFTQALGVSLWITEDSIRSTTQSGASGEYIHHALVRDAISETFGDPITTSTQKGDEYIATYEYTLKDNWVPENIKLVAFVSNMDAVNVNNREVQNAVAVELNESTVDIQKTILNSVSVYPNPFSDSFVIENLMPNQQIELKNILGKTIKRIKANGSNVVLNLNDQPSGVYLLSIGDEQNKTKTIRLIKQ